MSYNHLIVNELFGYVENISYICLLFVNIHIIINEKMLRAYEYIYISIYKILQSVF
jgi:hypothetical protein